MHSRGAMFDHLTMLKPVYHKGQRW